MKNAHQGHASLRISTDEILITDYLANYLLPNWGINSHDESSRNFYSSEDIYSIRSNSFFELKPTSKKHFDIEKKVKTILSAHKLDIPNIQINRLNKKLDKALFSISFLGKRKYFIAGGLEKSSKISKTAELYGIDSIEPIHTYQLIRPRLLPTSTQLNDGRLLILGGKTTERFINESRADIYDPKQDSIYPSTPSITDRSCHTANLLSNGNVLIIGGISIKNNTDFLKTVEIYNPKLNIFKQVGFTLYPHCGHTATVLRNGKILILGGISGNYYQNHRLMHGSDNKAELYDPIKNISIDIGPLNESRAFHSAINLSNQRILITGGSGNRSLTRSLKTAEYYLSK